MEKSTKKEEIQRLREQINLKNSMIQSDDPVDFIISLLNNEEERDDFIDFLEEMINKQQND